MEEIQDRFAGYVVENQNKLYRIAYCYVHNKDDALDIVQNSICVALEKLHTLRNPDAMVTWFYRILVNESINLIRKNEKEIPKDDVDSSFDEEVILINKGESKFEGEELMEEVRKLPATTQTIIYLHYFEEMKLKDIAKLTDTNESTVKSRLYSGLCKLRKNMEVYGSERA